LRETASRWESRCLTTEAILIKENIALKKKVEILETDNLKNINLKAAELSQVKEENRMLNSNLELSVETLNVKLEVLEQLKAELYELKTKYPQTLLQNDQLKQELNASREIISQLENDKEKIASKSTFENDDLRAQLGLMLEANKIKEEIEMAFQTTHQTKDFIDKQAAVISLIKDDLRLADRETRNEVDDFKRNAAVIEREIKELQQETVVLKESITKADWRSLELQLAAENYDLKRALDRLQTENRRISEAHESLVLSATLSSTISNEFDEKHKAPKDNLKPYITQLKTCQLQNDELKNNAHVLQETVLKSELTESQLRKEIEDLKAETESRTETFSFEISKLDRIKDKNRLLESSLEKCTIEQQTGESAKLSLKNDQLENEIMESRQTTELFQKENRVVWNTQETAALPTQKAEKLALEQVSALSEALTVLELVDKHAKDVNAAENTEDDPHTTNESKTDSKSTETRNNSWLKKWLINFVLNNRKPEENEIIKLLQSTGVSKVKTKRAKILNKKHKLLQ